MPGPAAAVAIKFAGVAAGSFAAGAITVATYAVVGAAIGAISSAVLGGDIGKGALFGAIGGAVMGGFSVVSAAGTAGGGAAAAVESGGNALASSGATAGMTAYQAAGTSFVQGMANTNFASSALQGGIQGGIGSTAGGIGSGLLSSEGGKMFAGQVAAGGLQAYAANEQAKESRQAAMEIYDKDSAFKFEQAALDREQQIKLAEMKAASSGSGAATAANAALERAKLEAEAAMARQRDAQGHQTKMWERDRDAKLDDQASFSKSVTGATDSFKAKVGRTLLDTPAWLKQRGSQATVQAQPVEQPLPTVGDHQGPQVV
jgi:hypothetical protein